VETVSAANVAWAGDAAAAPGGGARRTRTTLPPRAAIAAMRALMASAVPSTTSVGQENDLGPVREPPPAEPETVGCSRGPAQGGHDVPGKRALTDPHDARPTWRAMRHADLDRAAWAADGWEDDEPGDVAGSAPKERGAAQGQFLDLCRVPGMPTPAEAAKTGAFSTVATPEV